MRVSKLASMSIGAAAAILLSTSASAGIIDTYIGGDPKATNRATATNAVDAETRFRNAIGTNQVHTVDFESTGLPNSEIVGQRLTPSQLAAPHMTIRTNDPVPGPGDEDIGLNDIFDCTIGGFQVTPGGSTRLEFCENGDGEPFAELVFSFNTGVDAFGLFLVGQVALGSVSLIVDSETIEPQSLNNISNESVEYIGFTTDTWLSEVVLRLDPDPNVLENQIWLGIDDVTFRTVPEPATFGLLSAGLIGFGLLRRRRNGNESHA